MSVTGSHIRAFAFVILAGMLAIVIIAALLLFGVEPQLVFTPGFLVKAWLEHLGFHVSNRLGVLSTVLLLWGVIVGVRFAVARAVARRAA